MLATLYQDPEERAKAMSVAYSGLAVGLIGQHLLNICRLFFNPTKKSSNDCEIFELIWLGNNNRSINKYGILILSCGTPQEEFVVHPSVFHLAARERYVVLHCFSGIPPRIVPLSVCWERDPVHLLSWSHPAWGL